MQPIHRAPCQDDRTPSAGCLAGYLAELIDTRARSRGTLAEAGAGPDLPGEPDGNELIWVEGSPGLATEPNRGMIVVAHEPGQATAQRSFVISFPLDPGGFLGRVPSIAGALATLDWTVLAVQRRKTAAGELNTAVLASKAQTGGNRRLWLAEPSAAAPAHPGLSIPTQPGPTQPGPMQPGPMQPGPPQPGNGRVVPPVPAARQDGAAGVMRDQVEDWVNEGGSGDDVAD